MSRLRGLLRLDDKVAAEGRRLRRLGGPPLRWAGPLALLAAFGVHAAALFLPSVRFPEGPPVASPVPDFPRVWRVAPPEPPPSPPKAERSATVTPKKPPPTPPPLVRFARGIATEPVPEPPPLLVLNPVSANVEAIIPNPDPTPPVPEFGPPSPVAPPPPGQPALVTSVPPVYPVAARSLRVDGRVTLRLAVLPDGTVSGAAVEECTRKGLGFEAAALEAVKRWRYEPAPQQSGTRKVVVSVHFQAQEGRP